MNCSSLPHDHLATRFGFLRSMASLSSVALVFCTATFAAPSSQAAVIADFTHGGSSSLPVTNQVDAWSGQIGDGWLSTWTGSANSDASISATVKSDLPLAPERNRLEITVQNTHASDVKGGVVSRQYDAADLGVNQTISFQLRLDSDTSTLNRIRIFDGQISALSETTANANATWFIRGNGNGGNWFVHNGTTQVNTLMALTEGNVYDFTIGVTATSYVVTINNLTTSDTYTSESLNFYSPQSALGGYLNFSLATNRASDATLSLGSIQAIPEPGTTQALAFGLLAIGSGMLLRRWRTDCR